VATPARVAGVGVFVVVGLHPFAVGLFMIGDRQMAFAKKVTLYTEFKKITGLQPGAVVRVSGAKAGSITQILPPDAPSGKFRVEVEIVEDLHQLVRTDSLATIETEGLVGGNYLGITTGSNIAPIVAPYMTIAGKEPLDVAELLQIEECEAVLAIDLVRGGEKFSVRRDLDAAKVGRMGELIDRQRLRERVIGRCCRQCHDGKREASHLQYFAPLQNAPCRARRGSGLPAAIPRKRA